MTNVRTFRKPVPHSQMIVLLLLFALLLAACGSTGGESLEPVEGNTAVQTITSTPLPTPTPTPTSTLGTQSRPLPEGMKRLEEGYIEIEPGQTYSLRMFETYVFDTVLPTNDPDTDIVYPMAISVEESGYTITGATGGNFVPTEEGKSYDVFTHIRELGYYNIGILSPGVSGEEKRFELFPKALNLVEYGKRHFEPREIDVIFGTNLVFRCDVNVSDKDQDVYIFNFQQDSQGVLVYLPNGENISTGSGLTEGDMLPLPTCKGNPQVLLVTEVTAEGLKGIYFARPESLLTLYNSIQN